jgi:hypothetical protein
MEDFGAEVTDSDKHSSLLLYKISYGSKKVLSNWPSDVYGAETTL